MLFRLTLRGEVRQLDVRIRDDGLLDVLVHRGPSFLVTALDLDGDLRPALALPINSLFLENPRLVLLRIDLDFKVKGRRLRADAGGDLDGFAGCHLSVHASGCDPDTLLSSAHAQPMELGPV